MNKKVERNYLEINFLEDLKDASNFDEKYSVNLVDPVDFQLNKFFYKNIGKNHHWVDRLVWGEKQWLDRFGVIKANSSQLLSNSTIAANTNGVTVGTVRVGNGCTITVRGDWRIV